MTTIYTLSIGDNIFYVGKTTVCLSDRKKDHVCASGCHLLFRFIKSLPKSEIEKIEIIPIDECPKELENKIEWYWIHQMQTWGFKLYNSHKTLRTSGQYIKKYKPLILPA